MQIWSVIGDTHESGGGSCKIAIFLTFKLVMHCKTKSVVHLIVLLITDLLHLYWQLIALSCVRHNILYLCDLELCTDPTLFT